MGYEITALKLETGKSPFKDWFKNSVDMVARLRILKRITRLQEGNLGDCKSVGREVFELRIDFGPGYRIYFARSGDIIIVLLVGGDKSTQDRDIVRAQRLWEENKHNADRFQRDFW